MVAQRLKDKHRKYPHFPNIPLELPTSNDVIPLLPKQQNKMYIYNFGNVGTHEMDGINTSKLQDTDLVGQGNINNDIASSSIDVRGYLESTAYRHPAYSLAAQWSGFSSTIHQYSKCVSQRANITNQRCQLSAKCPV